MTEQLRKDLKAYTVKELKREVINVKKHFQVSKLRRRQIEDVILENQENFQHILIEGVRIKKEAIKQAKDTKKNTKQQKNVTEDTKRNVGIRIRIKNILEDLDEKAKGNTKRQASWYFDRLSGINIRKQQNHYVLHDDNNNGNVILSTPNRNEAEETIYLYTIANS